MEKVHKWSQAAIRIIAPDLGVDEVSARLGSQPTHSSGRAEAKFRQRGIWYLRSGLSGGRDLPEHLAILAKFIHDHGIQIRLLAQQFPAEVTCAFAADNGQGSFTIGNGTLKTIADAGLHLTLNLYPPGEDEIDENCVSVA